MMVYRDTHTDTRTTRMSLYAITIHIRCYLSPHILSPWSTCSRSRWLISKTLLIIILNEIGIFALRIERFKDLIELLLTRPPGPPLPLTIGLTEPRLVVVWEALDWRSGNSRASRLLG